MIGAAHDEVVLVTNTTHGLNTVLRNIEWREGDVILAGNVERCDASRDLM